MKSKKKFDLAGLQFFADPPADPTPPTDPTVQPPKTFTQEELDRIMEERLGKEKAKLQKEMEKAKTEAERLATLSAEERKTEEFRKQLEAFEQDKKIFELEKSKVEAMKILGERKLDVNFVEFVMNEDAKKTLENINTFEKLFKDAVKASVDERLKADPPKADPTDPKTITKEQFKKMSLIEQSKLYANNQDLYMKLVNEK